ncbi:MAG: hypothetical protein D6750_06280 [Bacteroidetes bacterium]|nr:MAG: hypothetical protein D6750_06280 [Bacteroidota bacterium]
MAEIRIEVDESLVRRRLKDSIDHKADWNRKSTRLYEIVMDVDRGKHTTTTVEESAPNYLLVNLELKVKSILYTYVRMTLTTLPESKPTEEWLNRIKEDSYPDLEWVLKDRYITGLGVLAVGQDRRLDRFVWYRVNPLHFYWDWESGLPYTEWMARRVRVGDDVYLEYWTTRERVLLDNEYNILRVEPNRIGVIPFIPILGYHVPNIAYPKGDVELSYPQQELLREVRRTILDHARRGAGLMLIQNNAIPDEELWKLTEPGEQWIRVNDTTGVVPIPTPPLNPEWLQVEAGARNDLESQSGVSEFLLGSTPIIGRAKFASEILAAMGIQNLRVGIEWMGVEQAVLKASDVLYRWAYHTPIIPRELTPIPPDDITIDAQDVINPVAVPSVDTLPSVADYGAGRR